MNPVVSVVIATYNCGRFLASAVDSVLAQTLHEVEVIVVDDGSTDDTAEIMRPYVHHSRVRFFRQENRGPAAARNRGIQRACAPLVAFLDADDVWLPEKLECQVPRFAADPMIAVVYSRRLRIDEKGHVLNTEQPPLYRGDILRPLFLNNFICLSSTVVRREALDRSGLFNERIRRPSCEDYDLWLRLALNYRFDYVDEPHVLYRTACTHNASRSEARLRTAMTVMRRFLHDEGARHHLGSATVRRAWAETYAHLGLFVRERSRLAALGCYWKSLAAVPGYAPAWKGAVSALLPERARRRLRRALRRPKLA
jgi:glycosyltransferase involved in cell wall biosynthesis